jgi:hypothetical protein
LKEFNLKEKTKEKAIYIAAFVSDEATLTALERMKQGLSKNELK